MFSDLLFVFSATILLLGNVGGQVFDVFGSSESEFGLEIDEVFLTDLETAPVSTHYMRPGKHFVVVDFVVVAAGVVVIVVGIISVAVAVVFVVAVIVIVVFITIFKDLLSLL
jgi:Flp pilus assembly protein TadB